MPIGEQPHNTNTKGAHHHLCNCTSDDVRLIILYYQEITFSPSTTIYIIFTIVFYGLC